MKQRTLRKPNGFTIMESSLMLIMLTAFSMVTFAVYRQGLTKAAEADDAAWKSKGGDESMISVAQSFEGGTVPPVGADEQPGLGGGSTAKERSQVNPNSQ